MIIKADAAQIEWRTKVYLAQDRLAMQEIEDGLDFHTDNVNKFGLKERGVAKIFAYRMIFADAFGPRGYGGPAYAYANDALFIPVSSSTKFWERAVGAFFEKYSGVREHSVGLIKMACEIGRIETPSGRFYNFSPMTKWNGETDWPRTKILNYPIQGLAADFMMCARLDFWPIYQDLKRKWGDKVLLISTVHDDVELDVFDKDPELLYTIGKELENSFRNIPSAFKRRFGVTVNVPMAGEVKMGKSLNEKQMFKFNKNTFEEDLKKYGV